MLLDKLADISTGLVIQRKEALIEHEVEKKYHMLTLKSFNEFGWINKNDIEVFNSSEILDDRYLSKVGDVIIRLTAPYTAIPIHKEFAGFVVPSQFCIIRVKSKKILPEYLAFTLNAETIRNKFIRTSLGATIPVIRMGALKAADIPFLNLEKQQKISFVRSLMIKDKHLRMDLNNEIDKMNKQIELQLLNLY
jgi:restriction endonuclease S subunit